MIVKYSTSKIDKVIESEDTDSEKVEEKLNKLASKEEVEEEGNPAPFWLKNQD